MIIADIDHHGVTQPKQRVLVVPKPGALLQTRQLEFLFSFIELQRDRIKDGRYLRCKTIGVLADAHGVELPIANVVRGIVWEGLDAQAAAESLASRPLTTEFYGL